MNTALTLSYQTAIDNVRVTARHAGNEEYHITVERDGEVVNTMCCDGGVRAYQIADILLQVYVNGLEMDILAH